MGQTIECVRNLLKQYLEKTTPEDLKSGMDKIDQFLNDKAPFAFDPIYSSIDLRDANFKLAPVDANLYPAGFNNICPDDLNASPEIIKRLLKSRIGFLPKKMAILPESHTKNKFYVDNLIELRQLFRRVGIQTEIGWLDFANPNPAVEAFDLEASDGRTVRVYPFRRQEDHLIFAPFEPEFILLNNDLSAGFPDVLKDLKQPIEPSPKMGWHSRKKSDFFLHYNQLAHDLALAAGIDPWMLQVKTELVTDIDFDTGLGMDRIAQSVDLVIADMQKNYTERGITDTPFVFIKNNAGTYGMGILKVQSGKELLELNRREKNKMAVGKNQLHVHEVIVQEGIPTRFQIEGAFAEPAIYMMGHELLGGFLRKNPTRGKVDNLNSKGMIFQKLCISDLKNQADRDMELELVYGTIARLSSAALRLEIAKTLGSSDSNLSLNKDVQTKKENKESQFKTTKEMQPCQTIPTQ